MKQTRHVRNKDSRTNTGIATNKAYVDSSTYHSLDRRGVALALILICLRIETLPMSNTLRTNGPSLLRAKQEKTQLSPPMDLDGGTSGSIDDVFALEQ